MQNINGIDDFSKGETFIGDVGLESHFGIFAGFEYARTEDITSVYFADANGDNLIDIVKDGKVYFNHIDGNGNPTFTLSSGDTPSPINAASGIDPDLVENDPQELETAIDDNPLHDVVKIWKAPFDGTVSVTQDVTLVQDTSADAQTYPAADGVRVAIQHKGSELWSADIAANDFTAKTPTGVNAIVVHKGDNIYFRVQSKFNGAYDQVSWTPEITYTAHTPALNDANKLPLYQFNSDKDFLLSGEASAGMSIDGQVHITGNFSKPATTDDVIITILKKSNGVFTTVFQQTLPWNQASNVPIAIDHAVLKNDALFFSVSSSTNIDWAALQWRPFVYYTSTTDPSVTQLFDDNNNPLLFAYPIVDFKSFNKTVQPSLTWTAPATDTFSVQANPLLALNFETGDLVFSVKKEDTLIAKQVIPVTLGVLGAHPPLSFIANNGENFFFEYHTTKKEIANNIISPIAVVDADPGNPVNVNSALHTIDDSFIFGPLYRHWGQFAYNGNRARASQPIIETDLHLDESLTDQNPPSIDLSSGQSAADMQSIYDGAGGNKPKEDKFIYLPPENQNRSWIGYDNLTYVTKTIISSSRMGKDNLTPVNPINDPSPGSGTGAAAINKVSNTDNFSLAVGIGPAGASTSFGYTKFLYDFVDMNGDRYPDIISSNKVQYTHPYGGLESTARNFSFGDASKSEHFSVGFTLGGTFLRSNSSNAKATPKGSKATKAASQSEISAGISGNFNYNKDSTAFAWMDINGDDLPDRVYRNGNVELNIGYSFLPAEQWGYSSIREGEALSYGAGFSINISNYSISAGIGLSRSDNEVDKTLQDMNGDGLLDYISGTSPLMVAINTGNGFASPIAWSGADEVMKAVATGESANGAFTVGIPIIPIAPVVKLCINPSFNVAQGADRTKLDFDDINGDGYPDLLQSDEDNQLTVSLSTIGQTNKLKKVIRPMGADFVLTYDRVGNTYGLPFSIWALSSVNLFDGVAGDGADRTLNSFRYENGQYNRHEREFYGFEKVIVRHHDTQNGDIVYRKIEKEFSNDNYYEKGLLRSQVIKDASDRKFNETIYNYELKDIHTGATLPTSFKQTDDGAAFVALVSKEDNFYEGQAVAGKNTSASYAYDLLGNMISSTDLGDPGTADDRLTTTSYHSVPAKYIMNIASSETITGSGQTYRQKATTIDNNGNVIEARQYLESGDIAKTNMEYDVFGNVTKITRPQNATGQRLVYNYEYDSEVQTYNTKITDSYGYESRSTHDVRFGQTLSETDFNGQQTLFTVDNAGRLKTVTLPFEVAAGVPFTISLEYHPEAAVPWAMAKHYDPSYPSNFIETASFCDGLGRIIQTKKDGALFTGPQLADQEKMLVEGESRYDAFGRTVAHFYPTTESKGSTGILNTNEDDVAPELTTYDVLDRVLTSVKPDLSLMQMEYGFGNDRNGVQQFETKTIDRNGISVRRYKNVRELLTAIKAQHSQGTDVWTSYQYNPIDELIKVTDDHNNEIVSTYDRMGRRTGVQHPDVGNTSFKYDLNDNLIEEITANLQGGTGIKYSYDHARLLKTTYPQNPQNNVTVTYGATGAPFFRAGRIVTQQDATGTQEFSYNANGQVVKNKRIITIPGVDPLTYTTEWTYDTWNRLTGMLYPDGERLAYIYNLGGQLLSMSGTKSGTAYNYLPQMGYDKFEVKVYMRYGNGAETNYAYESDRRRLQSLKAETAGNRLMMDNVYSYDKELNITHLVNNAPIPPSNLMGGKFDYHYTYDDLYRLTNANGIFSGSNHQHRYNLSMVYDNVSNIISKTQLHERKGYDELVWGVRNQTSYTQSYNYNNNDQPHAAVHIGTKGYSYDNNGNQVGWDHDVSAQNREMTWDEENRMKTLSDNGEMYRYTYDGSGERVLKHNGGGQTVRINGKQAGNAEGLSNYSVYVSPYMVVRSGQFTKHFYIEDGRIASKMGESGNGNSGSSAKAAGGNGNGNGNGGGNGNNQEAFQFYYHWDHLGNTAYVTNKQGEAYQHLEYFPFGETMLEEHGNQQRTPWLYNGKELDEETGLYYYGARYYDAINSNWQSVDPPMLGGYWNGQSNTGIFDFSNLGVYNYTSQNPINFFDPDGEIKAPSSVPNTPGIYILTNDNIKGKAKAYVGSGLAVNDRLSTLSHKKAQYMLAQPGTVIKFVGVDLGDADELSDKLHILQHFEMIEYAKVLVLDKYDMLNAQRPEHPKKKERNLQTIEDYGAVAKKRRKSCPYDK
ncbi:MAG TPA: RHS repeat-associated core domain-containing protein [Chitinophagaceae bacterium]|nr:RHS repeat-associated core domain-containing protein [Chitinophagaceae bacterium]